jgi:hypothetical protein
MNKFSNSGIISTAEAPFGGVKQSGISREGGADFIEEYVDTKYLCMGYRGQKHDDANSNQPIESRDRAESSAN